ARPTPSQRAERHHHRRDTFDGIPIAFQPTDGLITFRRIKVMGDIRELQSTDEEEALLRAILAEGAPADIDVDRAWAAFSQRIAAPTMRATSARGVRIRGRLITLPAIAATLVLAVL